MNYFVFIMHKMNKHGVSRWFTECGLHFNSSAFRTVTNITSKMVN